jgi:hypothetical protein
MGASEGAQGIHRSLVCLLDATINLEVGGQVGYVRMITSYNLLCEEKNITISRSKQIPRRKKKDEMNTL